MKVKLLPLKALNFELDRTQLLTQYYSKNATWIQDRLLILIGDVNAETTRFLDEKNVAYINAQEKSVLTRKKRSSAVLQEPTLQEPSTQTATLAPDTPVADKNSATFYRPIRSGEAMELEEESVFFARINSGAIISSSHSVQVFGIIDGIVRSDGEYLLLKEVGQGSIFFHGEELDKSQFNGQLKLVTYENNSIVIKEI